MDVRCQQCGVEYEFDDSRITPQGVTVKCSSCGHIFKVKREVRVVTEAVAEAQPISGDWMVRQPSGNVFTFKELTTLQRWIVERKVARDDEISRTGKTWKRLGDIAELASFFQVVDDATGRSFTDVQGLMAVQTPMSPALYGGMQVYGTAPAMPVASAPGQAVPALVLASPSLPPQAVVPQASPVLVPPTPFAAAAAAPPAPRSVPPTAASRSDDDLLDDEDPVRAWRQRRRWPTVLMVLLLVVAGALIGLRLFARPTFDALLAGVQGVIGTAEPPAVQQAIDQVQQAVLVDTEAALGAAIDASKRAIAAAPSSARPYAALALVEVGLAEAIDEQYRAARHGYEALLKRFPDGLADDQPEKAQATALADQASRLSDEAQLHFKRAADAVNEALTIAADDPLTVQAAADYNRAVGKPDEARRLLRALPPSLRTQALPSLIDALLELGTAAPTPGAVQGVQTLLQQHPQALRARYRLGLAQERAGELAAARATVQAVLAAAPEHERARAWLERATAPSLAPPPASAPASAPAAAPAVVDAKPAPAATDAAADADSAGGGSFDALMTQADRLRDQGKVAKAFSLYTRAAGLAPDRAEPRSGMGWCYVEQGKTAAAIASFQSALEVNPSFGEAHMGLAESYRARGTTDKALLHYSRYLEILPSGPDAAVAQRWVEELSTAAAPAPAPAPTP
jgi:predicted Zn finger-like uncharacterized protein